MLDPVATFGFLAHATRSLRFGTGITLLPQRNPIYPAKEFATLDWLTGGRMDFGIGVGWCKEEVIACGYSWEDRGARCDEFLELLQSLWSKPVTNYAGKHVQVEGVRLDPKPIQANGMPILVGGHGPASLRRAARFGSGWYGFNLDPANTAATLGRLDAALAKANRSRDNFEIIITPPYHVDSDMIQQYAELGVDRLVVQLGSQRAEKLDGRLRELEALIAMAA
jgi:probable F420-dependent oxidoreductase